MTTFLSFLILNIELLRFVSGELNDMLCYVMLCELVYQPVSF